MISRFLFAALLVLGSMQAIPARALDCAGILEQAESIRAMRDHDAAAGVEQGRELLSQIDQAGLQCPAERTLVYSAVAANLHIQGRIDAAIEAVETALALSDQIDDPVQVASVRRTAGVIYWEAGVFDRALDHYLVALEQSRAAGDALGAARAAGNIGNLHNSMSNWEEAREYHQLALAGFEKIGWKEGVAGTLVNLGALAARIAEDRARTGEVARAREEHQANLDYNRRALQLFEQLAIRAASPMPRTTSRGP